MTQSFFDEKVYELLPVINDFFESNKNDYVQKYVYDDYEPDTPELIENHKNLGKPVYIEDNNDPSHDGKYKYLTCGGVILDLNLTPLGPAL